PSATPAAHAAPTVGGRGIVKAIGNGSITLQHEPIPALQWPAMTMAFELATPDLTQGLHSGDNVQFQLRNSEQGAVITGIVKETRP
ncbi:MAG: copper-binding protein, partial [Rhodocyclaceae bacterium]